MTKPVFLQIKGPSGDHPGHVLEGFFTVQNDTSSWLIATERP
jgi:hypothetical protein